MPQDYHRELKPYAQELRKGMTKEERELWYRFLKPLPITFYRQKTIGKCIVDFYCAEKKLAIELDGSQHYEDEGLRSDIERDKYLKEKGITVMRFSNYEIARNFKGVCLQIANFVGLE